MTRKLIALLEKGKHGGNWNWLGLFEDDQLPYARIAFCDKLTTEQKAQDIEDEIDAYNRFVGYY